MARRPTYLKKSVKVQVERLQRKCRYCKIHRNTHGFDKHEAWCKKIWTIKKELQVWRAHPTTTDQLEPQPKAMSPIPPKISRVNNEFVEGSSIMPMEIDRDNPSSDTQLEDATVIAPSGMLILSLLRCLFLMFTGNITDSVVMFGPVRGPLVRSSLGTLSHYTFTLLYDRIYAAYPIPHFYSSLYCCTSFSRYVIPDSRRCHMTLHSCCRMSYSFYFHLAVFSSRIHTLVVYRHKVAIEDSHFGIQLDYRVIQPLTAKSI